MVRSADQVRVSRAADLAVAPPPAGGPATGAQVQLPALGADRRASSSRHSTLLRLTRSKPVGAVSVVFIAIFLFTAIFADVLVPHPPNQIDQAMRLAPAGAQAADGSVYLLGGDEIGRDLAARVIYGARISLTVAVFSVALGTAIGSVLGLASGYFLGKLDLIVQRISDAQQSIPSLLLAMLLIAVLSPSLWVVVLAIGIGQIPSANRIVRGAALTARQNVYVEAARSIGASTPRVMFRHILPNVAAPIIILATTSLGGAIIVESSLSFLGIGVPPPDPSWGSMISAGGRQYMFYNPMLLLAPATVLALTVLAFNMAGDALRDIWDPRLRGR
jgi:peptide/nickel transport system permease protein